jgi:hypothetical protein
LDRLIFSFFISELLAYRENLPLVWLKSYHLVL